MCPKLAALAYVIQACIVASSAVSSAVNWANLHGGGSCTPATALENCTGSPCTAGQCACVAGFTGQSCAQARLGPAVRAFEMNHTWLWGSAPFRTKKAKATHNKSVAHESSISEDEYEYHTLTMGE